MKKYGKKILFWDGKNADEFVKTFTNEDLEEMITEMDKEFKFDIGADWWEGYTSVEDRNYDVVRSYISRWLMETIDSLNYDLSVDLFERHGNMCA